MRIGLLVGPERGQYATKVDRSRAVARWAEDAGPASIWFPQIPDEVDARTGAAIVGAATNRIEVGSAVVRVQPRHPIARALPALSVWAGCDGLVKAQPGLRGVAGRSSGRVVTDKEWLIDIPASLPATCPA